MTEFEAASLTVSAAGTLLSAAQLGVIACRSKIVISS